MSEQRITAMEEKITYQEDTINQLDAIVYDQENRIALLEKKLDQLVRYLQDARQESGQKGESFDPLAEKPPHY